MCKIKSIKYVIVLGALILISSCMHDDKKEKYSAGLYESPEVTVVDATSEPYSYNSSLGGRYISANVHIDSVAGFNGKLNTVVLPRHIYPPHTIDVEMLIKSSSIDTDLTGREYKYAGIWNNSWRDDVLINACGYVVSHRVNGAILNNQPFEELASVQKVFLGSPDYQGINVAGYGVYNVLAKLSFPATVATGKVETANNLSITNLYPYPVTIQDITFNCNDSLCSTSENSSIIIGSYVPQLPTTLGCSESVGVELKCSSGARHNQHGGNVRIQTNNGAADIPFVCAPVPGG